MRKFITLLQLIKEIEAHGVPIQQEQLVFRCTVFEDNASALMLATNPKFWPRTKHVSVRLHHFRQHVQDGTCIKHIASKDQTADMFTKPLPKDLFERLRFQLRGWLTLNHCPARECGKQPPRASLAVMGQGTGRWSSMSNW